MFTSPENAGGKPAKELNELKPLLDIEFEAYKKAKLSGMSMEIGKLVGQGIMPQGELDEMLAQEEKELSEMDDYKRVAELVNNLRFWFPGGYYRQLLQDRKVTETDEVDRSKIEADERLVKDIDDVIQGGGYGSVAEKVVKMEDDIDRETCLKVLADVYFKMREKGYGGQRLRT